MFIDCSIDFTPEKKKETKTIEEKEESPICILYEYRWSIVNSSSRDDSNRRNSTKESNCMYR